MCGLCRAVNNASHLHVDGAGAALLDCLEQRLGASGCRRPRNGRGVACGADYREISWTTVATLSTESYQDEVINTVECTVTTIPVATHSLHIVSHQVGIVLHHAVVGSLRARRACAWVRKPTATGRVGGLLPHARGGVRAPSSVCAALVGGDGRASARAPRAGGRLWVLDPVRALLALRARDSLQPATRSAQTPVAAA